MIYEKNRLLFTFLSATAFSINVFQRIAIIKIRRKSYFYNYVFDIYIKDINFLLRFVGPKI